MADLNPALTIADANPALIMADLNPALIMCSVIQHVYGLSN